jgi:DNA-binding transcriptional regulator YiaG
MTKTARERIDAAVATGRFVEVKDPFGGLVIIGAAPMDAARLRQWRADRGLSAGEAALVFGISERTLNGLEQGRSPASPLWGPLSRIIALTDSKKPG